MSHGVIDMQIDVPAWHRLLLIAYINISLIAYCEKQKQIEGLVCRF